MKMLFTERLIELMEEKNLTSTALAKILNVRDTTVLRWRKGLINPTIDKLFLLFKAFLYLHHNFR